MAEPGTRFVLKRLKWVERYGGSLARQPGEVAVASFATAEEAEAERAKREAEVRARVNPFACGPAAHYWTHLDEPRLRDWLMDRGIDPPEPKKDGTTNWADWWKKNQKKLGAAKCAAIWEALDKVRFFAVRQEPARPVGYAVMAVNWEYNDEFYDACAEGGLLEKVYRSRERAEAECARLNERERENWAFVDEFAGEYDDESEDDELEPGFAMFDMQDRLRHKRGLAPGAMLKKGEGLYRSTEGVPFYEVVEVELEGLE
jgi:hypothetical protein